jgi:hypothetical protein
MEDINTPVAHLQSFADLSLDHVIVGVGWTVGMCGMGHWNLSDEEMGKLLGCIEPNAYVVLKQKMHEKSPIEIDTKVLKRISLLLSIWKNLQLVVPQDRPDLAYQLFNRPSSQLGGKSIKKYLLENSNTESSYSVNRVLCAVHC